MISKRKLITRRSKSMSLRTTRTLSTRRSLLSLMISWRSRKTIRRNSIPLKSMLRTKSDLRDRPRSLRPRRRTLSKRVKRRIRLSPNTKRRSLESKLNSRSWTRDWMTQMLNSRTRTWTTWSCQKISEPSPTKEKLFEEKMVPSKRSWYPCKSTMMSCLLKTESLRSWTKSFKHKTMACWMTKIESLVKRTKLITRNHWPKMVLTLWQERLSISEEIQM